MLRLNKILSLLILLNSSFRSEQSHCRKNTIKTTVSPTKCVAGRKLYSNWSFFKIPGNEANLAEITPPSWLAIIASDYAGLKALCSGILINDRYILTAQRCVLPPLEAQHIKVSLTNIEYRLSVIILHQDFDQSDPRTSQNDLALLKLEFALRFTRKLFPIQLPSRNDNLDLTIPTSTFGYLHSDINSIKDKFVQLQGFLLHKHSCKSFNEYYNYTITKELLCWKIVSDGDCFNMHGLVGAALTLQQQKRIYMIDVLIGILSWWWPKNRPCIAQENPFVYINVQSKLDWIINVTADARFCRY